MGPGQKPGRTKAHGQKPYGQKPGWSKALWSNARLVKSPNKQTSKFQNKGWDVPTRLRNPLFHDSHRLLVREPPDIVWMLTFQRSGGKECKSVQHSAEQLHLLTVTVQRDKTKWLYLSPCALSKMVKTPLGSNVRPKYIRYGVDDLYQLIP